MIVYLEPHYGDAEGNLDRARAEVEKALGFRGTITSVKVNDDQIQVDFKLNSDWDLPLGEKMTYLTGMLMSTAKPFKITGWLLEKMEGG